ncbi:hypothetical protein MRX96_058353 [Rhipicephalus microplus]
MAPAGRAARRQSPPTPSVATHRFNFRAAAACSAERWRPSRERRFLCARDAKSGVLNRELDPLLSPAAQTVERNFKERVAERPTGFSSSASFTGTPGWRSANLSASLALSRITPPTALTSSPSGPPGFFGRNRRGARRLQGAAERHCRRSWRVGLKPLPARSSLLPVFPVGSIDADVEGVDQFLPMAGSEETAESTLLHNAMSPMRDTLRA